VDGSSLHGVEIEKKKTSTWVGLQAGKVLSVPGTTPPVS